MWAVGHVVDPSGKRMDIDTAPSDGDALVHVQPKAPAHEALCFRRAELHAWDPTHERAECVDDITQMNAFSEASLLQVLRKRMLENRQIYT